MDDGESTMTPFADYLFQLRRARGLRQHEVAARLGLGAAYISALEAARKEPPSAAQVMRIATALALSEAESDELVRTAELSRSRLDIPNDASKEEYVLAHQFVTRLGTLSPRMVAVIGLLLQMNEGDEKSNRQLMRELVREDSM